MPGSRRRWAGKIGAARFVAPVSGMAITLRQPTGADDLLLAEHRGDDPRVVLRLVERLAEAGDDADGAVDWAGMPVTDIDALILRLRQFVIGDRVASTVTCPTAGCGGQVELSFGIERYLAHHQPRKGTISRRSWRVEGPDPDGWFAFSGAMPARFRLPTLGDQIEVAGRPDAAEALARLCMDPTQIPARVARNIETAISLYAPSLASALHGACPDCGGPIEAQFDPRGYCLQELSYRAHFVYEDVLTLADRCHWSERAILAMPQARRAQYVERARQGGA